MKDVHCTWYPDENPTEEGPYFVTCQLIDRPEKFTDVSVWQDGQWEITMPGNERVEPFKVIAFMPYPDPF